MYILIDDARVAQCLRDAGFCVILSNHHLDCKYLVLDSEELRSYLLSHFADYAFFQTDVVCF